ncbi:MAG: hypothetical protein KDD45_18400, partial [Bdellovibrionales bacterium]|nr:hypothetical protein [Bdellovibrionales bacterium]
QKPTDRVDEVTMPLLSQRLSDLEILKLAEMNDYSKLIIYYRFHLNKAAVNQNSTLIHRFLVCAQLVC